MTRDEAVERLWCPEPAQPWAMGKTNAEYFVDQLAAIGVLRLDEPKSQRSPQSIIQKAISGPGGYAAGTIINALDAAGYKIVEG